MPSPPPERPPERVGGIALLPEPDEAKAEHCERLAARHEPRSPEAADLRRCADLARNPATACRPGARVMTGRGLCLVGQDGQLTTLERPEDVQQRRAMLAGWEAAARESDRRIAAENAIDAKRQGTFAPAGRRTPASRPAARRPRRRSGASSRDGPDGESDEPPPARGRPDAPDDLAHALDSLGDRP